jgi:PhnB protein
MRLDIYLNYPGNCEEAFRFYEQHLNGKVTMLSRHGDSPNPNPPADWHGKVLHARMNRFAMLRDRFGTSWMLLHEPNAG